MKFSYEDEGMNLVVCKCCGAKELQRNNGFIVCEYCGARFTIDAEKDTGFVARKDSMIALTDDVQRLLDKIKREPRNARKYANLILDIDPDNEAALKYLRR